MPVDNLVLNRLAKKNLRRLPLHIHKKVIISLRKIKNNPTIGIKLHGDLASYYKFRVGDYRIIYSVDLEKSTVSIVGVEHRQGVYK